MQTWRRKATGPARRPRQRAMPPQSSSVKIEGDVTAACTNLAKDLGASDADLAAKGDGPGKKAEAACDAAAKFVGELKAKAHAKIEIKAKAPVCKASIDAMADCAVHCDANVKPGSVDVKCE